MRVGRSLSPGKVFLEKDGVLSKISVGHLKKTAEKLHGYHRSVNGMLMQWGTSDSAFSVDNIRFPVPFQTPPTVQTTVQSARAEVSNVTTTGFMLRTLAYSAQWMAFGR